MSQQFPDEAEKHDEAKSIYAEKGRGPENVFNHLHCLLPRFWVSLAGKEGELCGMETQLESALGIELGLGHN